MSARGIRDIWSSIVGSIERLALTNCYERLNILASLGLVNRFRSIAASLLECRGSILDAGCGPGTSTAVIIRRCGREARILALDPSIAMLRIHNAAKACGRIGGRFERLPLASDSLDGVIAMFSFRDADSYYEALGEFARVLRRGGRLVVLDIFRPKSSLARILLKGYLYGVGMIGGILMMCPGEGRSYSAITHTIDRMLSIDEMAEAMRPYFAQVNVYRGPFIAVIWGDKK
ncbi:MAG: methyltransferase domain-containing protein [Desulfurococcales archaeon]|nr:methyltransferase domain-containing protein [Desulfurococcales archaeon]